MNVIKGDATVPVEGYDKVIIMHCCNNIGAWGAGFVVPLGRKYPRAKQDFLKCSNPALGAVIFSQQGGVVIANIIGQEGIRSRGNTSPVRYDALETGFKAVWKVADHFRKQELSVAIQFPKMGSGLAGGDWIIVAESILRVLEEFPLYLVELST